MNQSHFVLLVPFCGYALFVPLCGLKNKLRSELNIAWVIALRRHETERRIRRRGGPGIQAHARPEVWMIERIQRLGAKLEPASLTHLEVLCDSEVRNGVWLSPQALERRRNVA